MKAALLPEQVNAMKVALNVLTAARCSLDELANTSAMVQEKLLRVIEYGEFERVGGKQTVKVDTRLVCD